MYLVRSPGAKNKKCVKSRLARVSSCIGLGKSTEDSSSRDTYRRNGCPLRCSDRLFQSKLRPVIAPIIRTKTLPNRLMAISLSISPDCHPLNPVGHSATVLIYHWSSNGRCTAPVLFPLVGLRHHISFLVLKNCTYTHTRSVSP